MMSAAGARQTGQLDEGRTTPPGGRPALRRRSCGHGFRPPTAQEESGSGVPRKARMRDQGAQTDDQVRPKSAHGVNPVTGGQNLPDPGGRTEPAQVVRVVRIPMEQRRMIPKAGPARWEERPRQTRHHDVSPHGHEDHQPQLTIPPREVCGPEAPARLAGRLVAAPPPSPWPGAPVVVQGPVGDATSAVNRHRQRLWRHFPPWPAYDGMNGRQDERPRWWPG